MKSKATPSCNIAAAAKAMLALAFLAMVMAPTNHIMVQADDYVDFNFGPHGVDQCDDPIAMVSNSNKLVRIPPRSADGGCSQRFCLGDCVAISIRKGDGEASFPINVIVGGNLPDPDNCSDVAVKTNFPKDEWDFSYAGKCGQGDSGNGYWKNCLVHDVCVWARCTDDDLDTGFGDLRPKTNDEFCGEAYREGRKDFFAANTFNCGANGNCPDPLTCSLLRCKVLGQEGDYCDQDEDCEGYCHLLRCRKGDEGDRCGKDSDCNGDLTCYGFATGKRCTSKKREGARCGSDADCLGYCQFLRCWDGSRGDKCKRNSDCQSNRCRRRCRFCAQRVCR